MSNLFQPIGVLPNLKQSTRKGAVIVMVAVLLLVLLWHLHLFTASKKADLLARAGSKMLCLGGCLILAERKS